ncbi:MAG: sigma-70 family RNA polymerase sigma factor [Betaproteobacteria bacterium]|nr:MAG: sigma-70 family RNA polymerase sigma factor [Betaproteobacteria bacterium]
MTDEQALLQAVRAGEPGAFERLVRQHQRLVWHVVQRLVRHNEDTRELCQETFLRVHRMLHQFRGESSLATWIGRVAYSIALRHLERCRIELVDAHDDAEEDIESLLAQAADPLDIEAQAASEQLRIHLHAAIEQLAPLPRLLLTLYHLQELPIPEIEHITGVPAGTIKSHLYRARLKLRAALGELGVNDV